MTISTFIAAALTVIGLSAARPGIYAADSTTVHTPEAENMELLELIEALEEDEYADEGEELLPGMFPAKYDSLLTVWHERSKHIAFETFFNEFIDIDTTQYRTSNVPDSVYEARLKMILSPVQMPYNHIVKSHIIAYTTAKKSMMSKIMGRSQYYFPMIEAELDRAGLPLELRMLPVIESALDPTAVSYRGAAGLWQFMYSTGRHYGLEVTSFVDERRDPVASTRAACNFLKDLYDMFGDWTLAIAAYNCGPGNVTKAIRRAGGNTNNFWEIYHYLPRETRGYIPSFIAATYAYTFHRQHDIEPAEAPLPLATDTIMVSRLMHFRQIESTIDTPVEVIRRLNPQYKADIVPAIGKSYSLTLPMSDISLYLENEPQIQAKDTAYLAEYLKPSNIDKTKKEFSIESFTYKVKSGDTLSAIASRNGVTVSQIKKWNNIKNADKLRIGQKLEIYR